VDADAGMPQRAILHGVESVDGYLLRERLPETAHAEFWRVQSPDGGQALLKLHRMPDPARRASMQVMSELRHECLVRVHAYGAFGAHDYEVQEYLPGGSLADWCASHPGPVDPEVVRDLVQQLHGALSLLQEHGVVHRDVKPGNLLLRSASPLRVALTDFDNSRADVHLRRVTQLIRFTPEYAAPEAHRFVVSPAGDWWSVGVIVLELLQGWHPLDALNEQIGGGSPSPEQRRDRLDRYMTEHRFPIPDGLPPEWTLLLRGLLTKERAQRWGSDQVGRWLAGERDIPHAYAADAPTIRRARAPYSFGRNRLELHEPDAIAAAFRSNWLEARAHLGRRMLERWIESELRDQALHHEVVSIREDDGIPDMDWKLALTLVALDRDRPLTMPRFLFDAASGERARQPREQGDRDAPDAEYDVVDDAWLAAHPIEALRLIGTSIGGWHERLTGSTQLLDWILRRTAWAEELRRIGPGIATEGAARLLAGPEAAVLSAAREKQARYATALDPQLELLRASTELTVPEAIVLLLAEPTRFHTPAQARAEERRRAVRALGVPIDPVVLERLLAGEVAP
jgi:serine/threonine protein kinase